MKKLIETLKNIWKIEDLRQRILITLLFVAIYRFGSFVVLPGINPSMLSQLQSQTAGGLRTWNHALYLCFYRNAASCCRCSLRAEDAA